MKHATIFLRPLSIAASLFLGASVASAAQNTARPPSELPPAESSNEPLPSPPTPFRGEHDTELLKQAGVGSNTSYARAGVLELGGGLTYSGSTGGMILAIAPTVGWFFADNFELSGIVQLTHSSIGNASSTFFTGLIEPSAHIPIVDNIFLFGGVGAGLSYDANRTSAGFAVAPRLGANFLIGRSGILTPSATWNWSSNAAVQTPQGTVVALNSAYGVNINYTVMW